MHPNSQRQLREVVTGWTGPASRLPITISLPRWLVVYRDSPHQHTGIVQRPCLTPFWLCSLITAYICRLHLTHFSHVEEKKNTDTHMPNLIISNCCVYRRSQSSTPVCSHQVRWLLAPFLSTLSASDRRKMQLISFSSLTFPVRICRTFKAPSARTEHQRCLPGNLCVK